MAEATTGVKKKSWVKRLLIGAGAGVVVLGVGGYVLVPVIAGSVAPGKIEEAAGKALKGSVKVGSVSVGWGGPVMVKGVELRDPEGKLVGTFDLESSMGIWKALGGLKDLGTTKVSGKIDIVRTTDASGKATTNLERAIESRSGASAPAAGAAGSKGTPVKLPEMAGRLEIGGIDATYEERSAGGATSRAAMKGLKGTVDFSTSGAGNANVAMDATFGEKLDGPATGSLKIAAKIDGFVQSGTLAAEKASVDASVTAKGVPVNLIDALANQGGVLSGALGATADATVKVKGTASAMDADVVVDAPNASADLGVKTDGAGAAARLHATRKGSLAVKSLAFVEKMPGVAGALKEAGVTVAADGWPGLKASIESLDVPSAGDGSWAGAKVDVRAFTTGPITGTVVRMGADGKPGAPEAMVVRPVTLGVIAPDLVKGLEVIGNTGATIGGQSAGDLDLVVQVTELIGGDGKLALASGNMPGKLVGKFDAKGVATGLLVPFLAGGGVPLDLPVDVGPTVDVSLSATTKGGAGSVPPTDIVVGVRSANVNVRSTLVYDSTGLGLTGEPTRVTVERAAPLVQRVLSKDAKPGEAQPVVSGAGKVELEISEGRLPVSGKKIDLSVASAVGRVAVSDLRVKTAGAKTVEVGAERLSVSLGAMPRAVSPLKIDGRLLLDGKPMDLKGDLKISGLLEPQELPRLGGLQTRRISGVVTLSGISGDALRGVMLGADAGEPMKRIAAELVGSAVDVRIDLGDKTNQNTQPMAVTVSGTGVNAAIKGELRADSLELSQFDGSTTITDTLARSVLELAGQKGEAVAGARLREPTGLSLHAQPLSVPLKQETLEPDWSRSKSIVTVTGGLSRPAVVDGLKVDGRSLSAGVANCTLDAAVPLSIMDKSTTHAPGAAGLKLSGSMDLVGNGEADVLARLRLSGGSGAAGDQPRVSVSLSDVSTARLDEIAGQGGLLTGLLGDKASVVAVVAQPSAGKTELSLDVDSPQLAVKGAQFSVSKDSYSSQGPMTVTLTASPALIEQRVLGNKPGDAAGMKIGEPVKLTLSVAKLVLSGPGDDGAGGLFKPGVFALDAVASSPKVVLIKTVPASAGVAAKTETTELKDVTTTLKSTGTAAKAGVAFTAGIGSMRSAGVTVTDATVVTGAVDNIADVGGRVQADLAVVNLTAKTGRIPTAVLDALAGSGTQLSELLGDDLTADIEVRDVSKTGSSGVMNVKLKSPKSSFVAGGPVVGGVLDTSAPGATPVKVELSEFKFTGGGSLLKVFPIFAEVQRAAGEANKAPAMVVSRGLKLPLDGDMSKLSGAIDIDIGRIDYQFSQTLGSLLDDTVFRGGRGQDQRPVPKFTVDIDKGVMRYGSVQQKVLLPVRNLDFQMRGVVDLVQKRIDVVTYIPTVAAAPGLVANLNKTVGGAMGKLVPGVLEKITAAPVRTEGPLSNPATAYAPGIVLDEFKDALKPENLIKGIGDLLGGGKEQPKPAPAPSPAPAPAKPVAPATPTGPTGPTAPAKPKK